MKTSLKYIKKYKKEIVLGPLFKLIEASFELLIPLVVARIIDLGIGGDDTSIVIKSSILMIILGFLGLFFSVTAQYFCARAAVGFGSIIRKKLFEKIQTFSYTRLDREGTATLITRLTSDVSTVQNGVNLFLRLVLRSPFIVFGAAIMAFFVDTAGALNFVCAIPILALIIFVITVITVPLHKKVQKKLDEVLSLTDENVGGARVIRAFLREDAEYAGFKEKNRALYSLQKLQGRFSALMNPVTYVVINAATITLLWTGALRVDRGLILTGAVVALFNYMSQILVEMIKFATVIVSITKAKASLDRIDAVLFSKDDETKVSSEKAYDGKVCFDNVTLRYSKDADPSLEGVSFSVADGESIGIIGGTGSGKTSLVNLIGALYLPESGTVSVDGRDILSRDKDELLSKIAYVPQKSVLFKGTVRDNLLWGDENADDDTLWDALRIAQADDFVREKGGLSAPVSQKGQNFSGGQRQRLCVARALVRKAEIIVFDDSSSALDFATDKAMRKALKNLSYSPCIFTVSQRTASVMGCDKIIVLDDGRVAGVGTHESLLSSCPVYKEIYDSQFKAGGAKA